MAEIWNDSPVTALAGLRPFRTIGRTSSTGIRPTAVALPGEDRFEPGAARRPEAREGPDEAPVPGRPEAPCAPRDALLARVVCGTAGWCLAGMTAPVRVNEGVGGCLWGGPAEVCLKGYRWSLPTLFG
ncbi:hypothetical protein GCM10009549_27600 [Streptomyces thermoalcalitolerans]|uniref:Uncharacterized protein n=1 Tax=Streptomyces thermoalcalitolerans TaxID=65605 RepID=A0ABN1NPT8_9ACTN